MGSSAVVVGAVLLAAPIVAQSPAAQPQAAKPQPQSAKAQPQQATLDSRAGLESGFRKLYEFRFEEARDGFQQWQKDNPTDPMGPTSEAASYLFEEFHRNGVLTSEFFLDDDKLLGGITGKPDAALGKAFFAAVERGRALCSARLKRQPRDPEALYAESLLIGMLGNYRALIERKHWEGVRLTERAEGLAEKVLAQRPDWGDAYLPIGASNYIVGCLPKTKRFFLWFGGVSGDKVAGLEQLKRAAEGGHLLRPYAKILLALAALRERDAALADRLFAELAAEFPRNPQFARELALLRKENGAVARP
jgi:hypothetical protein